MTQEAALGMAKLCWSQREDAGDWATVGEPAVYLGWEEMDGFDARERLGSAFQTGTRVFIPHTSDLGRNDGVSIAVFPHSDSIAVSMPMFEGIDGLERALRTCFVIQRQHESSAVLDISSGNLTSTYLATMPDGRKIGVLLVIEHRDKNRGRWAEIMIVDWRPPIANELVENADRKLNRIARPQASLNKNRF